MTSTRTCLLFFLVLLAMSCSRHSSLRLSQNAGIAQADSMMAVALMRENDSFILWLDSLGDQKAMSEPLLNFYRGMYYYQSSQLRAAEFYLTKALADSSLQQIDVQKAYKAYDMLSTTLYNKNDMEGSLKTATAGYNFSRNDTSKLARHYAADMLCDIASCQMHMERFEQARANYVQAVADMKLLAEQEKSFFFMQRLVIMLSNIVTDYSESPLAEGAQQWIERADSAFVELIAMPDCPPDFADRMKGRLAASKSIFLARQGRYEEAKAAYEVVLRSKFADTDDGILDRMSCLQAAKRWDELLALRPKIDSLDKEWDTPMDIYYITGTLAKYYDAYEHLGRTKEAMTIAERILNILDSISVTHQLDATAELATIYETQEKETKIAEQKATLARHQLLTIAIVLSLLIVFLVIFMFFRHRAAKKLEEKNLELERKNEELTIANARAKESSQMKTDFIQQISHEIRTPLNILSGFTQILTSSDMDIRSEMKTDIQQRVTENTERITSLVNKMLELSEASSHTVIERVDHVPSVMIAAQAVDHSGIGQAKQITFDLQTDEAASAQDLHTNLEYATRALVLLLDNARKFCKEGTVRLRVSAGTFIVEDTGIGIPKKEAEHIFEEFVQLDEYYDGTGIGLTVARSIARRLGGDIVLDTDYTGGARFVMTLPTE